MSIDPELIATGQKAVPGFVGALGSLRYGKGPMIGRILQVPLYALIAYYGCEWLALKSGLPIALASVALGMFGPHAVAKAFETWERIDLYEWLRSWLPTRQPPPPGGPQP